MSPQHDVPDSVRVFRLKTLLLSNEDRKNNGFITEPLTKKEIEAKRRCLVCSKSKFPFYWVNVAHHLQ